MFFGFDFDDSGSGFASFLHLLYVSECGAWILRDRGFVFVFWRLDSLFFFHRFYVFWNSPFTLLIVLLGIGFLEFIMLLEGLSWESVISENETFLF